MKFVPNVVSRNVGRKVLQTKKNSPHFFFAGGVAGAIASAVLACKATLKLEATLDDISTDFQEVKRMKSSIGNGSYTEHDYYKDTIYISMKSAGKIGKLYGPSVLLGAASITALTGSHVQLSRRNSALTFTLAAVSKAYEEYRVRVQEVVGTERERDLHLGVKDLEVGDKNSKEIVKVVDTNGYSIYARFFDETSPNWQKDAELNRIFLQMQQNYANHQLRARGHVFLNEIYDSLGLERSQAGAVVGWVINGDGDGFIDFGLFEPMSNRFVNGLERSILLDFNVDGVVYNLI